MLRIDIRALCACALAGALTASAALAQQPAPAAAPVARPQTPKPPFPYRMEDVRFESAPGVRLAGTITMPPGRGPFPAVVLLAGSGPHDRDGGGGSWTPLRVLADHLARHGIASLRYDKRGTAESTGDFASGTIPDFAADAEAALRFLQARTGIRADRVGMIGHSEGALIAPMVAARTSRVAFVVLLAAPGLPGDSVMLMQRAAIDVANGIAPELDPELAANRLAFGAVRAARDSADMAARLLAAQQEAIATRAPADQAAAGREFDRKRAVLIRPYWRHLSVYDPRPTLARLRVPVLAITGTLDRQVPWEANLAEIEATLKSAGHRDHRVVPLQGVNHLFQRATTGSPAEYDTLPDIVAPAALDLVTHWIRAHAGSGK